MVEPGDRAVVQGMLPLPEAHSRGEEEEQHEAGAAATARVREHALSCETRGQEKRSLTHRMYVCVSPDDVRVATAIQTSE